jgi:hypothetical protein
MLSFKFEREKNHLEKTTFRTVYETELCSIL